jgi:hypothetical protein
MQHKHEDAIDYMRRIVSNFDHERERFLTQLPSIDAVVEYFELLDEYGVEYMEGLQEAIMDGEDPKPLADFIEKYNLSWNDPYDWVN